MKRLLNMTALNFIIGAALLFGLDSFLFAESFDEECTIGVASGKATNDGRPLIWKTRDNSLAPDNELIFNKSDDLSFLEIVTAGKTYAWMGVNERVLPFSIHLLPTYQPEVAV